MSGEDLTTQAGLAVQRDLALINLLGLGHVERNGHHYVNGMMGLPQTEQAAFLAAHPDLYERTHGAVRLKIRDGRLAIGSLAAPGFASGAYPDWERLPPLPSGSPGSHSNQPPPQADEACSTLLVGTPTAGARGKPTPRIAAPSRGFEGRGDGGIQEALCARPGASTGPFRAWQAGWDAGG